MQLRLKEETHVVKERDVRAGASCREALSYYRKAKRVKLHGTPIVNGKTTNI
jgi:hypothetical protein